MRACCYRIRTCKRDLRSNFVSHGKAFQFSQCVICIRNGWQTNRKENKHISRLMLRILSGCLLHFNLFARVLHVMWSWPIDSFHRLYLTFGNNIVMNTFQWFKHQLTVSTTCYILCFYCFAFERITFKRMTIIRPCIL